MSKQLPTIPVLHIHHSQDAELYRAVIREDKVYLKGEKVPQFSNRGVFTVKDYTQRKKRKFKMLIYLDGKSSTGEAKTGKEIKNSIKLEDQAELDRINQALGTNYKIGQVLNLEKLQQLPDNVESLFEPLTFKDRITVVKREIAKQLGKFKPMETWQLIVIIALLSANLALQFIL